MDKSSDQPGPKNLCRPSDEFEVTREIQEIYAVRLKANYQQHGIKTGDIIFADPSKTAKVNQPCIRWVTGRPFFDRIGLATFQYEVRHPVIDLEDILS